MTKDDKEGLTMLFYGIAVATAIIGFGGLLTENNFVAFFVCLVVSYAFVLLARISRNVSKLFASLEDEK